MTETAVPTDLDHQAFLRDWSAFIEKWVHKTATSRRSNDEETVDLRQDAYLAGWKGYCEWRELPEEEQTELAARMIVARSVWDLKAKRARRRSAGPRARLLAATLGKLDSSGVGYGRTVLEAQSRRLVAYHLETEGIVHGQTGLMRQDTKMLRDEIVDRLDFAVQRLPPELRELIHAVFFDGRSLRELARDTGVNRNTLSERKREALDLIREEMAEFASVLSARNLGHTLDDVPTGGDAPT